MASNSGRRYGSSGRSKPRKRVVIGAEETVRVRYHRNQPQVESERKTPAARRTAASRPAAPRSHQGKRLSSAKREERERRQRAIRLRRTGILAVGAVLVALVVWGLMALVRAPVFRIETVVVTGASHLTDAEVIALARIGDGKTLLQISASEVEKRVMTDPWVLRAEVSRDLPDTLRIAVTERRPLAAVDQGGTEMIVVSRDGYWLGKRSDEESGVPIIREVEERPATGERVASRELRNAVAIVRGLSPQMLGITRVIVAPSVEKTALITTDDVEIFIGAAERIGEKERIARQILREHAGKVVYINVRVVDSPTWRGLDE